MKNMESITISFPGGSLGTSLRTGIGSMEETFAGKIIKENFKNIFCHSESDAWIWCPLKQQMNTDILPRSCSEVILP